MLAFWTSWGNQLCITEIKYIYAIEQQYMALLKNYVDIQ